MRQEPKPRIPLWKANTLQSDRRRQAELATLVVLFTIFSVLIVRFIGSTYGWPLLLDWAVVTIPTIVGFAAWVIPVKETQTKHKWILFVGGLAFSGLIYLQQYATRQAHTSEMNQLATKKDIADLPGAIVLRLSKEPARATRTEPGQEITSKTDPKDHRPKGTKQVVVGSPEINKQFNDIKNLITGQHWVMNAESVATLAQRMAPYASKKERGDLITCIMGDPDGTKFAAILVAAFRSAGWTLPGSGFNQAIYSGVVEGLVIKVHSKEATPPGLLEFVQTLRGSNIQPVGEIDANVPESEFQIIIGRKPS